MGRVLEKTKKKHIKYKIQNPLYSYFCVFVCFSSIALCFFVSGLVPSGTGLLGIKVEYFMHKYRRHNRDGVEK